ALAAPEWAIKNIWAQGASGIIGGKPKARKSSIAGELAISLWSGTPMFNLDEFQVTSQPASVLYVQQENANLRVQSDLQRILAARGLGELDRAAAWRGREQRVDHRDTFRGRTSARNALGVWRTSRTRPPSRSC